MDPIAEEWAARLAAQREGRPYVPKEQPTTKLAITGCGGRGAQFWSGRVVEQRAALACTRRHAGLGGGGPDEEAFGGFEDDPGIDQDDGWGQPTPQTAPGQYGGGGGYGGGPGGMGGAGGVRPGMGGMGSPCMGGGPSSFAPPVDYGDVSALENIGQPPKPPVQDEINWGILGEGTQEDAGDPFAPSTFGGGGGGGGQKDVERGGGNDEEEDDEFTVFAGFDKDNRPTNKKNEARTNRGASSGEGLSWDAERKACVRSTHTHTRLHRTLSSAPFLTVSLCHLSCKHTGLGEAEHMGRKQPLLVTRIARRELGLTERRRVLPLAREPARIRSQAERVFNDSYSNSLFTSPALQRFKAQTDSMLADVQSFVNRSSLVSVVTGCALVAHVVVLLSA